MAEGHTQGAPERRRWRPGRVTMSQLGMSVLSGILVFLSYPRFDLWPLAFVATVPLLLAIRGTGTRRAFVLGGVTGLVANLGGFYWIIHLLREFGEMPAVAAVPLYVLLCVQQGLVFAVAAWLRGRLGDGLPGGSVAAWPVALVASEWCVPMIFKWYFGNSQYLHIPLAQLAELGGPLLVTAAVAMVSGGVVDLLPRGGAASRSVALRRALAAGVLFLAAEGWGWARMIAIDREAAAAEPLRVGVVEADLGIFEKAAAGRLDSNLVAHQQLSVRAAEQGAQLIIWPETAYEATTFFQASDAAGDRDAAAASARPSSRLYRDVTWLPASDAPIAPLEGPYGADRDAGVPQRGFRVPLLAGTILYRVLPHEERALWPPMSERPRSIVIYNSALLLDGDGRVLGISDKHMLMPFSEAVPFGHLIWRITGINLYRILPMAGDMVVGQPDALLRLPDPLGRGEWKIGVMNCYEDISPSFGRRLAELGPNVLINITNDAWFGKTAEPWLHLALATFRAIETRASLVRATNTGVSAFIDPVGRIRATTSLEDAEYLVRDVPMMPPRRGPYARLGAWPGAVALAAALWTLLRRWRRP